MLSFWMCKEKAFGKSASHTNENKKQRAFYPNEPPEDLPDRGKSNPGDTADSSLAKYTAHSKHYLENIVQNKREV